MAQYAEALERAKLDREKIEAEDRQATASEPRHEQAPRRRPDPAARRVVPPQPPPAPEKHILNPEARAQPSRTVSAREQFAEGAAVKLPRTRSGAWAARAVIADPRGVTAEGYRYFAVRLTRTLVQRNASTVLITSALRHEGKTTTACNLALALASMTTEGRVALVDLDLHKPSVGPGLGVMPRLGFERVLAGQASLDAARLSSDVPHLDLFLPAAPQEGAHELLSNPRFGKVVETLAKHYRFVVFDTPPVLLFPDVPLISEHVDACVSVTRAGFTRRSVFREMLALLPRERHVGSFLNRKRSPRHLRQYGAYAEEAAILSGRE